MVAVVPSFLVSTIWLSEMAATFPSTRVIWGMPWALAATAPKRLNARTADRKIDRIMKGLSETDLTCGTTHWRVCGRDYVALRGMDSGWRRSPHETTPPSDRVRRRRV